MKKVILVAALVAAIVSASPVKSDETVERNQLIQLEQQWNSAYNRQDKETVGRIVADDYMFIDADAYVLNKRQYIDTISLVQVKSDNLKTAEVRLYGDTGIVTTLWNGTYSFNGKDTTETIRYSDVFLKRNGKWQVVASQGTRVPTR